MASDSLDHFHCTDEQAPAMLTSVFAAETPVVKLSVALMNAEAIVHRHYAHARNNFYPSYARDYSTTYEKKKDEGFCSCFCNRSRRSTITFRYIRQL